MADGCRLAVPMNKDAVSEKRCVQLLEKKFTSQQALATPILFAFLKAAAHISLSQP